MEQKEFARRGKQLMRMMGKGAIAIVPTATELVRNRDVEFPFRPDSDFYYLTGFKEPDAVAVLVPGRKQGEYLLFCRERDPDRELWDGSRAGQDGAQVADQHPEQLDAHGTDGLQLGVAAYLLGGVVNFSIPSAGGEWAVIGPPLVDAIRELMKPPTEKQKGRIGFRG